MLDAAERNRIVEDNLALVISRVLFLNHGVYDEDLVQVGAEALCIVAGRFDPTRGCKLATYAVPYIDGYIKRYKIHDSDIKPMRKRDTYFLPIILSFETPTKLSDHGEALTLGSLIEAGIDVENEVTADAHVDEFMKRLSVKERQILKLRSAGLKQKEIAAAMHFSQAEASRKLRGIKEKYIKFKSKPEEVFRVKLEDQSTVFEHVPGDGQVFLVTAAEPWSIGLIKRLKKSRPDEVNITAINKDGSLVAELPLSWMRILPTRVVSEERRAALAEKYKGRRVGSQS